MLPDWVSYCHVGDFVIFLDERKNRYSALSSTAALPLIGGDVTALSPKLIQKAAALGWTLDSNASASRLPPANFPKTEIKVASRLNVKSLGLACVTVFTLMKVRLLLATRPLQAILERVANDSGPGGHATAAADICDVLAVFSRIETLLTANTCLLRSLALREILSRNGYRSQLVFGVKLHPFEAHCWLQRDDQVINDTLEQIGLFVPIKTVG